MRTEQTTYRTEMFVDGQAVKVEASVEVITVPARLPFEHFGYCGTHEETEATVHLIDFFAETPEGAEVSGVRLRNVREQLSDELARNADEIAGLVV